MVVHHLGCGRSDLGTVLDALLTPHHVLSVSQPAGPSRHTLIAAAVAVIIITVGLCVYKAFDPSVHAYPRCLFLALTGWECPGCGSQRALHALMHGQIAAAWGYNSLLLIEIPIFAVYAVSGLAPRRWPRLHRFITSRGFILSLLTVIILWTILRNL